jgi:hypothetical protein
VTTPASETLDIGDSRDIAEGEPATSHSMSVTRGQTKRTGTWPTSGFVEPQDSPNLVPDATFIKTVRID